MIRNAYTLLGHVVTWGLERIVGRGPCDFANATHVPLWEEDDA